MYTVKLNFEPIDYLNDAQDIPRAFSPYLEIDGESENTLGWTTEYKDGNFCVSITSNLFDNAESKLSISDKDFTEYKRLTKRFLKTQLYNYLSSNLSVSLPYGSLTGVRPTKLYYELKGRVREPKQYLAENFFVTADRAQLIEDCVNNQTGYINHNRNETALFVNIPFCPTRCNYCSFISTEVGRVQKELPLYVDCVCKEIDSLKKILDKGKYKVSSIYIGGGTPTSIGNFNLSKIVSALSGFGVEFTVECGRPDTVDEGMLDMLKMNNVTRVSINPQTFVQSTLDKIGRKHTVEEIFIAYGWAKERGFSVNMDLIAMLSGETFEDFAFSVSQAVKLKPQNITVHTLSLKRGSTLTGEGEKKQEFGLAQRMVDYSRKILKENAYLPYYMYRQKNTADNLENVGYCLDGYQCKYNIDMMEESITVIGSGAGAMSKKVDGNKIERMSLPKGFREYCDRIDTSISAKEDFLLK